MACCSSILPQPCAMLFGMPGEGEAEGYRVRVRVRDRDRDRARDRARARARVKGSWVCPSCQTSRARTAGAQRARA